MSLCFECNNLTNCKASNLPADGLRKFMFFTKLVTPKQSCIEIIESTYETYLTGCNTDSRTVYETLSQNASKCPYVMQYTK